MIEYTAQILGNFRILLWLMIPILLGLYIFYLYTLPPGPESFKPEEEKKIREELRRNTILFFFSVTVIAFLLVFVPTADTYLSLAKPQ